MEDTIDLFEQYQTLPQEVQDILLSFKDEDATYEECERLLVELFPHGYTFDYGLDACPFNLKQIKEYGVGNRVVVIEDWVAMDNKVKHNHGVVREFIKSNNDIQVKIELPNGEFSIFNHYELKKLY